MKLFRILLFTAAVAAVISQQPTEVSASPVDIAAAAHEALPTQVGCDLVEMTYKVVATDGGVAGVRFDGGAGVNVAVNGATPLAGTMPGGAVTSFCGDKVSVRNQSAVPLRCRSRNARGADLGSTVCNHTGCDFSNGLMEDWVDPCKVVCNIPAINRDAGQFQFTATIARTCRQ